MPPKVVSKVLKRVMIARTVFNLSDGGYVAYKKANHAHAVKRPNCMFEWWREYNRVLVYSGEARAGPSVRSGSRPSISVNNSRSTPSTRVVRPMRACRVLLSSLFFVHTHTQRVTAAREVYLTRESALLLF